MLHAGLPFRNPDWCQSTFKFLVPAESHFDVRYKATARFRSVQLLFTSSEHPHPPGKMDGLFETACKSAPPVLHFG